MVVLIELLYMLYNTNSHCVMIVLIELLCGDRTNRVTV